MPSPRSGAVGTVKTGVSLNRRQNQIEEVEGESEGVDCGEYLGTSKGSSGLECGGEEEMSGGAGSGDSDSQGAGEVLSINCKSFN